MTNRIQKGSIISLKDMCSSNDQFRDLLILFIRNTIEAPVNNKQVPHIILLLPLHPSDLCLLLPVPKSIVLLVSMFKFKPVVICMSFEGLYVSEGLLEALSFWKGK